MQLVKHSPAEVYLAARTPSKAEAAIEDIKKATPGAHVTYLPLDLMSFDSIKKAADEFKSKSPRLDILMNNAGIMATPLAFTKEGYESQLGTNHVGHALFTKLLLPMLLKTAEEPNSDVRIVNLSSDGHNFASFIGGIVLDQEKLKTYNPVFRYGNSKLANILYSRGLAKRYPQITSVAVHPGVIYTDLYAPASQNFIVRMGIGASSVFWTGIDKGAWNQLWASTIPKANLKNGAYYTPVGNISQGSWLFGYASNEQMADELWDWTKEEFKKHGF
jgi:NAD(P)-dependent dehydrogenase (short-subunit alcohol dehydrogenase family)